MKPIVVFNGLALASVVAAVILWFVLLGLFEHRIGTPIIARPGEEPFAYDTDVMPFVPCCGLIGYLVVANLIFASALSDRPPFKRAWWVIACIVFLAPFALPLLVAVSAIFFPNQPAPIILRPAGS